MRDLIGFVLIPFRVPWRLLVAAYAQLFWPQTTQLTGRPIRLISVGPEGAPFRRVRDSLLAYHAQHGHWPTSYADLDPYGVIECSRISSVLWTTNDDGSLTVKMFIRRGKCAFDVDVPA